MPRRTGAGSEQVTNGDLDLATSADCGKEVLGPGGALVGPGGRRPHSWGPDGDARARVSVVFTPPGSTAHFFDTYFALAREGNVDAKGLADPIRMAETGRTYDVYLGRSPRGCPAPHLRGADPGGSDHALPPHERPRPRQRPADRSPASAAKRR